jgi:predicted acetyltransferase
VGAGGPLAVALEVNDAQLPDNGGPWRLVLDQGRATVERGGGVELTLRLDIATLSRLYVAALSPTGAYRSGLLECDQPALLPLLDPLLALPQPWLFDRF